MGMTGGQFLKACWATAIFRNMYGGSLVFKSGNSPLRRAETFLPLALETAPGGIKKY